MTILSIPNITIQNGYRLILKPVHLEDKFNLSELFSCKETFKYISLEGMGDESTLKFAEETIQDRINKMKLGEGYYFHIFIKKEIINKDKDQFIGLAELNDLDIINHKVNLSIVIHKRYQRLGYGTETLYLIMRYAFEIIQINRLHSDTLENNEAINCWFENIAKVNKESIEKQVYNLNNQFYDGRTYPVFKQDWFTTTKQAILCKLKDYFNNELI